MADQSPTTPQLYIVAEISKNWPQEHFDTIQDGLILAERFEAVINFNWRRGYILQSWQLSRLQMPVKQYQPDQINETIIAIFKLRNPVGMDDQTR